MQQYPCANCVNDEENVFYNEIYLLVMRNNSTAGKNNDLKCLSGYFLESPAVPGMDINITIWQHSQKLISVEKKYRILINSYAK